MRYDEWDTLGLLFCGLCIAFCVWVILKDYADSHRPRYDDRVPRRHRTISRNAFKSRIGAREYR
jgi:hypothetical protein